MDIRKVREMALKAKLSNWLKLKNSYSPNSKFFAGESYEIAALLRPKYIVIINYILFPKIFLISRNKAETGCLQKGFVLLPGEVLYEIIFGNRG